MITLGYAIFNCAILKHDNYIFINCSKFDNAEKNVL